MRADRLNQSNRPKQRIYKRMALNKKHGNVHARKLGKRRIRRLFAELSRQDKHFKSIGGYIGD